MTALTQAKPSSISRDASKAITTSTQGSTLADILERVLDKGIVIAGDISVSVASTELLNIRIRLIISSVDKAREIGINWWENNPHFSSQAAQLIETNRQLQQRIDNLETELRSLRSATTSPKQLDTAPSKAASEDDLNMSLETLSTDF